MKTIPILAVLIAALSACGGNDRKEPVRYSYQGTVSGFNCFDRFAESAQVAYSVTIDELATGSAVTLVDERNIRWVGEMTTPSSFKVNNSTPNADPRTSIVASGITASEAHVDATAFCVSFRCCTTLSGNLHA